MTPAERPPGIGLRLAARLIDGALVALAGWGLGRFVGYGFGWLAATAALVYGYFVVLDAAAGRTAGKALLGLRVQGAAGRRPSVPQACAREAFVLLGAIPFAGPLLALVAWVAIAVSIRRSALGQGIHDRLAGGTRVALAASIAETARA